MSNTSSNALALRQHQGASTPKTRVLFPNFTMRAKLIAFFVAMVASVAVVMVALVVIATHTTIEEDYELLVLNSATSTAATLTNLQERVTTYTDIFSRKEGIANALAFNDIQRLEQILTADYQALYANDSTIATLEVTDNQGIVIMRGHNPSKHGDNKSAVPMIRDALQGKASNGLTVSITTGEMAMDAVMPLRHQGEVVGTIKVGSYLRQNTVQYLSAISNSDVAFIAKNHINASTVSGFQGEHALPAEVLSRLERKEKFFDILTINDQEYNIVYQALYDGRGQMAAIVANLLNREHLDQTKQSAAINTVLVVLVLATVSLISTTIIAFRMTKPLLDMQQEFIDLAAGNGDLTKRFPEYGKDEISKANEAINRFLELTHQIVREASNGSHETATASEELSATSESLASNIAQQFDLVERTGVLVNEVGANLDATEELAVTSTLVLEEGYKMLSTLLQDLAKVNEQILHDNKDQQEVAKKMESLNQEANQIASVLAIISNIADQTNLLALNASIEAARAGEQGRGFAVVANEVRVLAERTQSSLGDIRTIINSITQGIGSIHGDVNQVANSILSIANNSQGLMDQAGVTQQKLYHTVESSSELVRKSTFIAKKTKDLIEIMQEMVMLSQENKNAGDNISDVAVTLAQKSHSQLDMLQRFKT
ncbi:methyl-accepting chemotaxis protein [Chrysiogenes arsenatis]|uniref:methyl-accepting chemotaxis protein n=1 Tax=Chrysiogenes arsenatis TaxID=309797 RepID=UPI00041F3058|nr:methyl-accepting chemotaxis protein [Chrysiogenes arsenatis]